jgi:hypothetical protein
MQDRNHHEEEIKKREEKEAEQQKVQELKQRYCFRCTGLFTEASNTPKACKVHPGKIKGITKSYSCCGEKKGSAGCKVLGQHIGSR